MPYAKAVLLTLMFALATGSQEKKPTTEFEKRMAAVAKIRRDRDQFELFNDCKRMWFSLALFPFDEKPLGLEWDAMYAMGEKRMRLARLYHDDTLTKSPAELHVDVSVVGAAFGLNIEYRKSVVDKFGNGNYAATWNNMIVGTHGGNKNYIMSSLSEQLDKFLTEYLRVNEKTCEK